MKTSFFTDLKQRHNKNTTPNLMSGLTLIELIVVIAIFMVITGVVLFNYNNFSSSVSLQNLTDDIALSVRKAQSFAIGSRGVEDGTDRDFSKSYGIHFSVSESLLSPLSGSNRSFLMFSVPAITDDADKYYIDTGGDICAENNECIELFNIMTIDKIETIQATDNTGLLATSPSAMVDIIFTRPDPSAYLCYRTSTSNECTPNVSKVDIIVSNGHDESEGNKKFKTISIQNTGQISIQ